MSQVEMEQFEQLPYPEMKTDSHEADRCVDGRKALESKRGPQTLGGSLHPVTLWAIQNNLDFNRHNALNGFRELKRSGFKIGMHRGSHKNPEAGTSDCGAADRLDEILKTALEKKVDIRERLHTVYMDNHEAIPYTEETFMEIVDQSFAQLEQYQPDRIQFTGDELVSAVENDPELEAFIEEVQDNHNEEEATVNLKHGFTHDTEKLNDEFGRQRFNMDLWAAVEQSQAMGVESNFATGASLILYEATEIVLVENKGKDPLPVTVHS